MHTRKKPQGLAKNEGKMYYDWLPTSFASFITDHFLRKKKCEGKKTVGTHKTAVELVTIKIPALHAIQQMQRPLKMSRKKCSKMIFCTSPTVLAERVNLVNLVLSAWKKNVQSNAMHSK